MRTSYGVSIVSIQQKKLLPYQDYTTENKGLSVWQFCHHWWHCKLSLWQLTVLPMTTKLSNWRSLLTMKVLKDSISHEICEWFGCAFLCFVLDMYRRVLGGYIWICFSDFLRFASLALGWLEDQLCVYSVVLSALTADWGGVLSFIMI